MMTPMVQEKVEFLTVLAAPGRLGSCLERDAVGDRERAHAVLNDVVEVTYRLGMTALHRQAVTSRDHAEHPR